MHEYLVINVSYKGENLNHFVSANYRLVFSQITQEELDAYLQELEQHGWTLLRMQAWGDGWVRAYYYMRSMEVLKD